MSADDEKIVDLYWGRDERAIEETDKKYRGYLFSVARNILGNSHDCDAVSDKRPAGLCRNA